MKTLFKNELLVLVPETDQEQSDLATWKTVRPNHVLLIRPLRGTGLSLSDLGPQEEACREPFQVLSTSSDPAAQLISNFAPTPFQLDGLDYQCVEAFWQGLKFDSESERRRIAMLPGRAARQEGQRQGYPAAAITFAGRAIPVGTWDHWDLMRRACWEKFTQNEPARQALLSTGQRPLQHRVRRDSHTIPGVIMCEIWMQIRQKLQKRTRT